MKKNRWLFARGFTLIELMLVVVIIAVLLVSIMWVWKKQAERGFDAKRKDDLYKIKVAFEDYYNDKGCYPPTTIIDDVSDCGTNQLSPYLAQIPCDPQTKLPYKYYPINDANGEPCKGFRAHTALKDTGDLDIRNVGCNAQWCGFDDGYNYGVASGVPVPADGFDPGSEPVPPPPPSGPNGDMTGPYACSPGGICNSYGNPVGKGCPSTYHDFSGDDCLDANGVGQCANSANRCLSN